MCEGSNEYFDFVRNSVDKSSSYHKLALSQHYDVVFDILKKFYESYSYAVMLFDIIEL